jgi:Na+/melibiose symporter-like transporter
VAVAAAAVVMLAYPLTERAFRSLVAELAERRSRRVISPPAVARA